MSTEITTTPRADSDAVALIREAMKAGASPEYMRELLAVRREWQADEARKAFNLAVSEFQRRAPIIAKADKAYDKEYARMDRIWRETRPLITELGMSVTWQVCELRDGMCHVEGQLRHRDGHGEKLVFDCPLPAIIKSNSGKDAQNAAQQMGSASTYAKRYAFCAALGIVTGDDDDGNGAGANFITHDQAEEVGDLIDACRGVPGFHEQAFWGWAGATCTPEIKADRYADVCAMLRKKLKGGAL